MCVCCVLVCFPFLSISLPHGICDVSCHSQRYWCKLYWKAEGDKPFASTSVWLEPTSLIDDFRQAVFERHPKALEGLDASHLNVIDDFAHIFPFHFAHSHMAPLADAHP
jgi:hypothetical protein